MHINPLVLIDGSGLLFRAFYALPPLTTAKNHPTGAIFGVINMLKKILNEYNPKLIAVIFDTKGKNFRHDLYAKYKANRSTMPEELALQIEPLKNIINAMGITVISKSGVEADDVIGTLATKAAAAELFTLIISSDKDFAQLVNNNIYLVNTMNNVTLDKEGVINKFGVPPELIQDYLALMGDSSDNIPGVPKVGPKTAVRWLTTYGNLDSIIQHADKISGKVGENLRDNLTQLALARELVAIKTNIELPVHVKDLAMQDQNIAELKLLFTEFEFTNWLKLLDKPKKLPQQVNYINNQIPDLSQIEKIAIQIIKNDITIAINESQIFLLAIADAKFLEKYPGKIIAHDLKTIAHIFAQHNIKLPLNNCFDTMLASYVLNSTAIKHELNELSNKYLQIDLQQPDPTVILQLQRVFEQELQQYPDQYKLFTDLEMPLLAILLQIEQTGVLLDQHSLATQSTNIGEKISLLGSKAFAIAEQEFNLNSPKQLQEILFEKLNLPILKKTPKGQPSTAEPVLQEMANSHPLPGIILEYRSLSKLKSTYLDSLPKQVNVNTQRVHTTYHQAITTTGRLSSSDPNLQNIPIRTKEGRKVRDTFIAAPGYKIVAADYSQIELRIMAYLSQDQNLLAAFANHQDVHTATAAEVFNVATTEVTEEQRSRSKAINFGLIYGMSAFGLAKQLKTTREAAQQYIDLYFAKFPRIKGFMEDTKSQAITNGYVTTIVGRRLYLPEIKSKNIMQRKAAERAAINAPMQGSCADFVKRAMIDLDHWINKTNLKSQVKMLLQVHDEIVFEIQADLVEQLSPKITNIMQDVAKEYLKLEVTIGVGDNWGEAH